MTKNDSMDSPQNQLALLRMQLQMQAAPTIAPYQPVASIGEGISQGVHNVIAMHQHAQSQKVLMNFIQQQEAAQRAHEAASAQNHSADLTNFLIHSGVDPQVAIDAGSASVDSSTVNALLSHRQEDAKYQKEMEQKGRVWSSTYQSILNSPGFNPNNPQNMAYATMSANKAAFGAEPLGASQLGEYSGGVIKNGVVGQLTGGNPQGLDKSIAGPSLQTAFSNYGITPHDAVSELRRQSEAQGSAIDTQYKPALNTASLGMTNANIAGKTIDNNNANIDYQRNNDQYQLGAQYGQGAITPGQYVRGSLVLSPHPIADLSSITNNKQLYGHGNSLIPNAGGLQFAAPQPPQAAPTPAVPPSQPFFQINPNLSPEMQGAMVRQQLGQRLQAVPGQLGQGYANFVNGINTPVTNFGRQVDGFFGLNNLGQ